MYHIIYNPKSRSGQGKEIWLQVRRQLMSERVAYREHQTTCRGDAGKIAERLTREKWNSIKDVLVVIGGDGTVNEAVNGIHHLEKVKFGYIPTGSGNDFARGIGISTDPMQALKGILHSKKSLKINVGVTRIGKKKRRFVISSGLGYDAAICHEALSSRIKEVLNWVHLGKLTYVVIALRQLFRSELMQMDVCTKDGRMYHFPKVLFAVAMNLPYEGGGFMFTPDASCQDGKLDLMIVNNISNLKVLMFLPLALKGKHTGFSEIHTIRCREVQISVGKSQAVHMDGESGGYQRSLVWGIEPEKLEVLT